MHINVASRIDIAGSGCANIFMNVIMLVKESKKKTSNSYLLLVFFLEFDSSMY